MNIFENYSKGVGCAGHGIYTRLSEYERWVLDTIRMNN